MDMSAAHRASVPGAGSASPWSHAASFCAPDTTVPTAAAARARPMKSVAMVSYLPWP